MQPNSLNYIFVLICGSRTSRWDGYDYNKTEEHLISILVLKFHQKILFKAEMLSTIL